MPKGLLRQIGAAKTKVQVLQNKCVSSLKCRTGNLQIYEYDEVDRDLFIGFK